MVGLADIVIKPGPARRVDPGPGRPGGWTGPGFIKDRLWQQPGRPGWSTRNPGDPGEPGRDPVFFFFFSNVGF